MMRAVLILLLVASAGANVVLLRRAFNAAPRAPGATAIAVSAATLPPALATDPTAPIDPQTWEHFTVGGDLADLAARLRVKGFPPEIIRLIVTAQVRAGFKDRFKAIEDAAAAMPYWRHASWTSDPKTQLARRALHREIDEAVFQVLGSSIHEISAYDRAMMQRNYGNLTPEKIAAIQRIGADYSDLRAQITAETGGVLFPEDREKLAFLEKEQRADLARTLTPEELEAFDLRSSRTAGMLRATLAAFEPSEQEFRALFKVMQPLDAQFPTMRALTPEERRQRTEAEKQLAPQIEAALGPERYADYQRMTNPDWLQTHRYVTQNSLPSTAVGQLVEIQQNITRRATALREDRTLTAEQRDRQLAALNQEANSRLATTLGSEKVEAYKDANGYWLQSLRPSPERVR